MKLTRAAFAVLLKFADGIQSFYTLVEDIDLVMKDMASETDDKVKIKKTIEFLKER